MKQLLRFKTFLLMAVLSILAGTSAWADEETIQFSNWTPALVNGTQYTDPFVQGDVSVTFAGGSNDGKYYTTGTGIRTYGGGSISVSAGTKTITKIVFTFSGTGNCPDDNATWDPSTGTVTTGATTTWEGSATTVKVTRPSGSGHWRLQKVQVTYESASTPGDTRTATTIAIDDSGITNTNVFNGTAAGSLSATVSANDAAINASVTWAGDNDAVATIDAATGVVTLVSAGSVKFTASYAGDNSYKPSSKTYTLTVTNDDPNGPGTENNPYTVAQARAAIDASTGVNGVYATGIVSEIITAYGYNNYSNITFNIVTQDGDSEFLQAFRCVSSTNADASTIAVGDIVVVSGNLTKYNTTYEFAQGCQVVSITHPAVSVEAPTFSPAAGTYADAQSVTISTATDGATVYYTTDGTEPTDASTPYTKEINISTTTTLKAIAYKGGESSTVATATYYICSAANPYTVTEALAFPEYPANGVYVQGIVSTAPTQTPTSNGQLTYYISVDGQATDQLQVYKGLGLNQDTFTAQDDIQVGDEVTIYGNVKIYNSTKEFDTGNYLVAFNRPVVATPSITIDPATYTMDAKAGGGVLPVVSENLASDPQLAVVFVEADGVTPATYDWITATINNNGNIDGAIQANTGDARTAYFYVTGKDANGNTVQSNLVTFTQQAAATEPYITVNTGEVNFEATGGEKTLSFDYENLGSNPVFSIQYFESDGTTESSCGWISYQFDPNDNKVTINGQNNDEDAARTAYFKIYAEVNKTKIYSNLVTVNQAAPAVPVTGDYVKVTSTNDLTDGEYLIVYEDGNLAFDGNLTTLDASSNTVAVTIDNNTIASTTAVDAATFTIDVTARTIQSASGYYIGQTSDANGLKASNTEAYTNTISIDADGNAVILASGGAYLRYNATSGQERFRYFKSSTYSSQKAIALYKKSSSPAPTTPSITLPRYDYTMDAKAGSGELTVTCSNMPADPQLEVLFYESDGTTSATYDWISAVINNNGNIYGQIQENTGAARTAYFKVHGVDADNNDVYSNLVTFTQEAPVAATPTIVFNPESIDFDANGGSKTIGGDYFQLKDFDSTPSLEILYYESDGDTEKQGGYDWLTADFNSNNQIDFTWGTNTGAARTAYLKIHAVGTTVYSNLFTVNQAAAATPDVAHYYQKVSSSADLTNGDYLIVYEEGNVAFNGGLETLDAASNTIDVTIVGDKIEGNSTTDAATFTIDVTAGTLQSASGLYIGQTSDANGLKADGSTAYKNTLSIDADGNADVISSSAHLRYNATSGQDRFRYFKSASYTGQKAIQLYKRVEGAMPAASPALAVTPDVVTVPYTGGAESFTVTPSNVENAIGGYVTFYDPTDTETTVDQPKWIGISYDYSNMSLSYTITDENNTGAERTACFKYFIMCDNGGAMSNLVTVKQEAYVAPVASIAVDPNVVNATSVATEGTIDVTYNNITTVVSEVKFYDADGTTEATYDWIEAEIDANNNVYYVIDENNGVARTAYLKVYALDDDANDVYSELITINQAAYVAPALTQINLTKTLVFDTDCGLASGGYAVNDELTELSGTFEGDASATRFGGFVIKDSYINGGSIQMKANTGSIAFPAIESEYGFDVTVAYKTNDAIVYISGVSSTEASSGIAHLIIATGSKYCQITSITLTPKTSEVPPTVDVEEPTITEADGLVEIIAGSDNAQVIYTTDGTDPTYNPLNGTVYTEPFNITVDTTIKAIGVDADGNASDVVEVAVTAPVVSGVKYYKVTSTDQLEEGVDYLLVYEGEAGEGAAAYGGLNSYTGYSIGKSVALKHIGGSVVTITDEEVVPVTLKSRSEDGTKWAMRDATGWIAAVNGYNNLHGDKTEDDAIWTFDFTADANKQIFQEFTATSTRYLQYNTSSPRFAGYTGTQSAVYLYKAASYNVSVGATGYATLYYGTKNLVVPENVEAYTYTVNNGKLEESYLYSTNEVIPAGTGVVLKAPAGEYKFAVTTEAGLEDTDNLLFGFDTPSTTVAPAAGDYLFYLLGVDNGKVGFYWGNAKGAAFTSGAHKAYLAVPTEQASGLRGFSFDGSVVGINTIGVDMPEGNAYDLQGRRVQQFQKNGLYIVDGKKMLAK